MRDREQRCVHEAQSLTRHVRLLARNPRSEGFPCAGTVRALARATCATDSSPFFPASPSSSLPPARPGVPTTAPPETMAAEPDATPEAGGGDTAAPDARKHGHGSPEGGGADVYTPPRRARRTSTSPPTRAGRPTPPATGSTATLGYDAGGPPAVAIAAGDRHTCALRQDGTVACWGANDTGQLGNGSTTAAAYPVNVTGITSATQVVAGWGHTCALIEGGRRHVLGPRRQRRQRRRHDERGEHPGAGDGSHRRDGHRC